MYIVFEKKRCALQANERTNDSNREHNESIYWQNSVISPVACRDMFSFFFIDFPYAYAHRCDDFTLVFECCDGISWENDIFFSYFHSLEHYYVMNRYKSKTPMK